MRKIAAEISLMVSLPLDGHRAPSTGSLLMLREGRSNSTTQGRETSISCATVVPSMTVHPGIVSSLEHDHPSMKVILQSRIIPLLSVPQRPFLIRCSTVPKQRFSQPSAQSIPPSAIIEYIKIERLRDIEAAHQAFRLHFPTEFSPWHDSRWLPSQCSQRRL